MQSLHVMVYVYPRQDAAVHNTQSSTWGQVWRQHRSMAGGYFLENCLFRWAINVGGCYAGDTHSKPSVPLWMVPSAPRYRVAKLTWRMSGKYVLQTFWVTGQKCLHSVRYTTSIAAALSVGLHDCSEVVLVIQTNMAAHDQALSCWTLADTEANQHYWTCTCV